MLDLETIAYQVNRNCRISDATHAGLFSICGLAMRLRDLYKWEKELDPWVEDESAKVLEWIGEREEEWDTLGEEDFGVITIAGREYDPLDTAGINRVLNPYGFYYGAGYVQSLKPTFFLAVMEEKRQVQNQPVIILGRELARDLVTIPALSRDGCIIIRKAAARVFFWDEIFYIKKSGRRALRFALAKYGVGVDLYALRRHLERILAGELNRYIYHELGEIKDQVFDRALWREMVGSFPHTPIELLVRSVKDLLADTNECGTLPHILKKKNAAMLGFYTAFLGNVAKEIFPEILDGFAVFAEEEDWSVIEKAIAAGKHTASRLAREITGIFLEGKRKNDLQWTAGEVKRAILEPLGMRGAGSIS